MILVTGGTGLVGTHLLLELTRNHDRVRAIHRPSSDTGQVEKIFNLYLTETENRYHKIEWVPGDVTDIESILEAMSGVGSVYHTAADVSFNPGNNRHLMQNNAGGTANVVNACLEKQIRKLCYVSSTSALGSAAPGEEITEDLLRPRIKNRSGYSLSKHHSELEVWRGMAEGLNAVIVNPSLIVGPGDWTRSSSRLFAAVWKGLKFYTEGITGFVDVRDVVRVMIGLMESNFQGERFIISSENLSYRQVLEMIARELGKSPPRIHATPLLSSLAWRADWLASSLAGRARTLTRDTARSAANASLFSNRKVREALGVDFRPVSESIKETACMFLKMQASGQSM